DHTDAVHEGNCPGHYGGEPLQRAKLWLTNQFLATNILRSRDSYIVRVEAEPLARIFCKDFCESACSNLAQVSRFFQMKDCDSWFGRRMDAASIEWSYYCKESN